MGRRPEKLSLFRTAFLSLILGTLVLGTGAHASELSPADVAKWESVVSGNHSFRSLGEKYFVDLPMRRITHVKLGFFNERRARALGVRSRAP